MKAAVMAVIKNFIANLWNKQMEKMWRIGSTATPHSAE
jgi:hypothetical protein